MGQIRRRLDAEPLLSGPPRTIGDVDDSFRRLLPHIPDWRRVRVEEVEPYPAKTFLGAISAYLGTYRDEFMLTLLVTSVRKGERVFAVVGASHVVMQEPVLRRAFPEVTRVACIASGGAQRIGLFGRSQRVAAAASRGPAPRQ